MCAITVFEYAEAISKTKTGLRVLIANNVIIEQVFFLEIIRQYLPNWAVQAVDKSGLENKLNQADNEVYDLVVLEERILLDEPEKVYINHVRDKYPIAKIALFVNRERLSQLRSVIRISEIDIMLTKNSVVEAIAEKFSLAFQIGE
ncbi:hypothetical protein ACFOET_07400 [Parapedobacter deserti]|uniref:Response regulatory domain-containing protein n=1 Tax=Parapedobacter deserti TaxID=1912957 RepID=A0ABV7JH49_9SPHI